LQPQSILHAPRAQVKSTPGYFLCAADHATYTAHAQGTKLASFGRLH
jgi:hypothetical protein